MSDEAFARAIAREARIWEPFNYSFPFDSNQIADRIIIMGLYASSYLNNHKYLQEVESEELAYLLADYNAKMAELTTQQQIVVADIVGKRYLASVDKLIHDQKMISKQQGIDYDNALMDAKFAALEADRAALTTMSSKIETARINNEAKIAQLQAYIQIEGYNKDAVEIEISEKEIQSAKVDIRKIDAQNDILKIQNETVAAGARLVKMDIEQAEQELKAAKLETKKITEAAEILRIQVETVEAAMQLIDIDLRIASTKVDIAQTQRNIAKLGLLQDDLLIEKAKTAIEQAGIPISAARIELARAKYTDAVTEKLYVENTLTAQAATSYQNKSDLLATKQTVRLNELIRKEELQLLENEKQLDVSDMNVTIAGDDQEHQVEMDAKNIELIDNVPLNNWEKVLAAIEVAKTLAKANIVTTLTHTIQKKTTEDHGD